MTAPVEAAKTKFTSPLHNPHVKRYGLFAVVGIILLLVFIVRAGSHASPKDVSTETATAVVDALANKGVFQTQSAPTTTARPAPDYDYVTCTHIKTPADGVCTPLRPYPLTTEAQQLIGWQNGTRVNGTLNSDTTRDVADGILSLPGVDACTMYLGLKEDDHHIMRRTVYPDQKSASVGAVKLYDCTPVASAKTPITSPTAGGQ